MTQKSNKIKVGITLGDPNGIGGEIILKAFQDSRMLELYTPVVFAQPKLLSYYAKSLDLNVKINGISESREAIYGKFNALRSKAEVFKVTEGKVEAVAGDIAVQSLRAGVQALKDGEVDVLVTAPIHKESIQSDSFNFPGHTDFLNQELEGDSLMFMISKNVKIGLITDHVPLKDVVSHITPKAIKTKIGSIKESLKKDFRISKPKIAVLGINPHVGDNGVIGDDDQEILIPALEELREDGTLIFGPYAADAFFGNKKYLQFDAVLAGYHDQGLIPFKTLTFGSGVNYTAGLSHVRTSPDHGTGFDIAGQNIADPSSFIQAIHTAADIYQARIEYAELTSNTLKTSSRGRR
ncbi:MAG: 4-hydroxythreonine-4-phosphate dehydrogenase PdxA [Nonlabens sp.]